MLSNTAHLISYRQHIVHMLIEKKNTSVVESR